MFEEYEKKKRNSKALMMSIMDYSMGLIILFFGIFFLIRGSFKLDFNNQFPPDDSDKIFGIVCLLYGVWRVYRGYSKQQKNKRSSL